MDARDVAKATSILFVSAVANILLWFLLKYYSTKKLISPSSYLTIQFGFIWTAVMVVAAAILFSNKAHQLQFVADLKKLKVHDYVFMAIASGVAVLGFYLVINYFNKPNSKLSVFVPLRTLLAVVTLILLGHFYFKEQLNKVNITCALLIGKMRKSDRDKVISGLKMGKISIVVGTHALIQKDVAFHELGLVIIDEQHRFGVNQRSSLLEKGENPHSMAMTATPIPRTLAITYHGDMDISIIDELPLNRIPIITKIVNPQRLNKVYKFMRDEVSIVDTCKELEQKGGDVVGMNCHRGPNTMMPYLKEIRKVLKCHVAGLPIAYRTTEDHQTFFNLPDNNGCT